MARATVVRACCGRQQREEHFHLFPALLHVNELGELGSIDHNPEQHPPPQPVSNGMPSHPQKPPPQLGSFNCRRRPALIVVAQTSNVERRTSNFELRTSNFELRRRGGRGVSVFRWPAARCFGGERKERWLRAGFFRSSRGRGNRGGAEVAKGARRKRDFNCRWTLERGTWASAPGTSRQKIQLRGTFPVDPRIKKDTFCL
jgi:hypothetical protein